MKKRPDVREQLKRIIKTKAELALLKRSARITDSCIPALAAALKKDGVTEKQLAATIDRNIRKRGARLAFGTIVASGKHSNVVHAKPTRRIVRGLGYADFGAMWKGYRTDITVPFVKGEIGAKEQRILDTTLKAYAALTKLPRRGMPCWKMQDRFDAFLKKRGYATMHSLGHGIGLDIHELPSLTKIRRSMLRKMGSRKKKRVLERWKLIKELRFEPDQVFTIEPGVYAEGVGGCRYENDFIMTRKGPRPITHSRLLRV